VKYRSTHQDQRIQALIRFFPALCKFIDSPVGLFSVLNNPAMCRLFS